MIHCYCFSSSETPELDVRERAELILGGSLNDANTQVYHVRNVAPNKEMMCLSFRLPEGIAFCQTQALSYKRPKFTH